MELRQFKYFIKAKELLNFTEAAHALFISQSTLSQQIRQLEDELGIPLFNRIGKRVTLTEAGTVFFEYAQNSLRKAEDGYLALKDLKELKNGTLNIGITYGMRSTLLPALIAFSEKYPNIKNNIVFGTTTELKEKLKRLELDFAITFFDKNKDMGFKYRQLFTSNMSLVTQKSQEWLNKTSISLQEVATLPLALPAKGYSTTQFINEAFEINNLRPMSTIEINDIPTLLDLVRNGKWYTILAQTTVSERENLLTIPIEGENMMRTALFLSLKEVYEKKAVLEFLDIIKTQLGK